MPTTSSNNRKRKRQNLPMQRDNRKDPFAQFSIFICRFSTSEI